MMLGFVAWASAESAALMRDASAASVRTARCHKGVLFTVASFWLRVEVFRRLGHSETQTDEYLHMDVRRQRHARPRSVGRNRTLVPSIRYRSSSSRSTGAELSLLRQVDIR